MKKAKLKRLLGKKMKTIRVVDITPKYVKHAPANELMEQNVFYISKEFRTTLHLCFCGCGNLTVCPLWDVADGDDRWCLKEHEDGTISLFGGKDCSGPGSVYNYQLHCQSHYVIRKNKAKFLE